MRKVILYIATSLDGYIAGPNHELDWLFHDNDYGYTEFYNSVDTTLMGNETYKQILTFGDFPYKGKENFVFTRNPNLQDDNNVKYIAGHISEFVKKIKKENGKNIWLIGGGQINSLLLKENLIDEIIISIHPLLLGDGISLFPGIENPKLFKMTDYKDFPSGLVQIQYEKN